MEGAAVGVVQFLNKVVDVPVVVHLFVYGLTVLGSSAVAVHHRWLEMHLIETVQKTVEVPQLPPRGVSSCGQGCRRAHRCAVR